LNILIWLTRKNLLQKKQKNRNRLRRLPG